MRKNLFGRRWLIVSLLLLFWEAFGSAFVFDEPDNTKAYSSILYNGPVKIGIDKKNSLSILGLQNLEVYGREGEKKKAISVQEGKRIFLKKGLNQRYLGWSNGLKIDFFVDSEGNAKIFSLEGSKGLSFVTLGGLTTYNINSCSNIFLNSKTYENIGLFSFGEEASVVADSGIWGSNLFRGNRLDLRSAAFIKFEGGSIEGLHTTLRAPSVSLNFKSLITSTLLEVIAEKFGLRESRIFSATAQVTSKKFFLDQSYFHVENPFSYTGDVYRAGNHSTFRGEGALIFNVKDFDNLSSSIGSTKDFSINLSVASQNPLLNHHGRLFSLGDLLINAPLRTLDNIGGAILSQNEMDLNIRILNNKEGSLLMSKTLSARATRVYNTHSKIRSEQTLDMRVSEGISNAIVALISGGTVRIQIGESTTPILSNKDSSFDRYSQSHAKRFAEASSNSTKEKEGGDKTAPAIDELLGNFINSEGSSVVGETLVETKTNGDIVNGDCSKIESPEGRVSLEAQSRILNHDESTIKSKTSTHLASLQGNIFNNDGGVIAGPEVILEAQDLISTARGRVESTHQIKMGGKTLDNTEGKIFSEGNIDLKKMRKISNIRGKITAKDQLSLNETELHLANGRGQIKAKQKIEFKELRGLKSRTLSQHDIDAGGTIESEEKISFEGVENLPSFLRGILTAPILEFHETASQKSRTLEEILGYKSHLIDLNCESLFITYGGVIQNNTPLEDLPYSLNLQGLEFYNSSILKTKKKLTIKAKTIINEANLDVEDRREDNCFPFPYLKHAKEDEFLSQVFEDLDFRFSSKEKPPESIFGAEKLTLVGTKQIFNYGGMESAGDTELVSPHIQMGWAIGDEETEILTEGDVRRDKFDWKHHFYKSQPNCYLNVGGQLFIEGIREGKFLSTLGLVQVQKGVSVENLNLFLNFGGAFHIGTQPEEFKWRVPYFLNMLGIIDTSIVSHRYWQIDYANTDPAEFNIGKGKLKLRDIVYALNAASFLYAPGGIEIEGIPEEQKRKFLNTFEADDQGARSEVGIDFATKVVNQNYVKTHIQTLTKTGVDVSVEKHSTFGIGSKSKSYTYWRRDYPEAGTRGVVHAVMSSAEKVGVTGIGEADLSGNMVSDTINVQATGAVTTGYQGNIKLPEVKELPEFMEILPEETHGFDRQMYVTAPEESPYILQTSLKRNFKEKIPMVVIEGAEKVEDLESYKMLLPPEDIQGLMTRLLHRKMNTGYIPSMKQVADAGKAAYDAALQKNPSTVARKNFVYLPQESGGEPDLESETYYREILVITPEEVDEGLYFVPKIINEKKCLVPVLHLKKGTLHPDLNRPDGANIAEKEYVIDTEGKVILDGVNIGKKKFKVRGKDGVHSSSHTYEEDVSTKERSASAEGGFLSSSSKIQETTHHHTIRRPGLLAIAGSGQDGSVAFESDKDILLTGMNLIGGDVTLNGWRVLLNTLDLQEKILNDLGQEVILPTYVQTLVFGSKKGHIKAKIFENHGSYYLTVRDNIVEAEYEIKQEYASKEYRQNHTCRVKQSAFSAKATEDELYQTAFSTPEMGSLEGSLKLLSQVITAEGIVRAPERELIFKGETLKTGAKARHNKHTSTMTQATSFGGAEQKSTTEMPQFLDTHVEGKTIQVDTKTADFEGTTIRGDKLTDMTTQGMTVRPTVEVMLTRSESSQSGFFGTMGTRTEAGQEVEHRSSVDVKEWESIHVPAQFTNVDWDKYATLISGIDPEERTRQLTSWVHTKRFSTGIGQEGAIIVALAVSVATGGAGSGILAVMGNAAFSTLCSTAAVTFLQTGGDLQATCRSLASVESLKTVIAAAATAGVVNKLAPTLGITLKGADMTPAQHAARAVFTTGTQTAVTALVNQEAPDLSQAARLMVANVVQGYAANQLGKARAANQPKEATGSVESLDGTTHKILHAAVGAAAGAILDPKHIGRGALAGAIGAAVAEMVAEGLTTTTSTQEEIQRNANTAKIMAGIAALATGQGGVGTAVHTGTTAIDENFLQTMELIAQEQQDEDQGILSTGEVYKQGLQ